MASEQLPLNSLKISLRRLELCSYAIQEIHTELDEPQDPEAKADLILATERLVGETIDLYATVRRFVWGEVDEHEFFVERKEEED